MPEQILLMILFYLHGYYGQNFNSFTHKYNLFKSVITQDLYWHNMIIHPQPFFFYNVMLIGGNLRICTFGHHKFIYSCYVIIAQPTSF